MKYHAWLLLLASAPLAAAEHTANILTELQFDTLDAARSWTERGPGHLRAGNDGDSLDNTGNLRLALEYHGQFTETLGAYLVLDSYAGDDAQGGVSEAWLAYSPVPTSAWQHRARAGGFIPPFSLEHTGMAWTSPYMPTASVLNSWIGEELHVTGAEYTLRHLGAMAQSPHTFTLRTGAFMGNDTAGTVLSWRGWATNDRVTPRGDALPLPNRAAFRPGGTFPGPKNSDPFVDLDGRPGYYVVAEWRYADRMRMVAGRYDNRADPLAFEDGQAGWRTRFDMLGIQLKPLPGTELLAQIATGNTFVGRRNTERSADNDFRAAYLLASHRHGAHRLSARLESFVVTDEDPNLLDDNREDGEAWALAWQYEWPVISFAKLVSGIEFLQLRTERPEWALLGRSVAHEEQQLRLLLRATF